MRYHYRSVQERKEAWARERKRRLKAGSRGEPKGRSYRGIWMRLLEDRFSNTYMACAIIDNVHYRGEAVTYWGAFEALQRRIDEVLDE